MSRFGQKQSIGNPIVERQPQDLYSRVVVQTDASRTYQLFTTATSDEVRDFLTSAGQLNFPDKHYATGISYWVPEDVSQADLIKFRQSSLIRLFTSTKRRVQVPLYALPSAGYLQGQLAGTTDASFVAGGGTHGMPYDLKVFDPQANRGQGAYVPLIIESQQSLKVELVVNAPTAFSATFDFAVHIHGTLEVSA
jgi:hypothetical protein